MVERVRINSSQIILKDSDNRVSFNTANFYLKTDPNGQLKAGGYAEVPSIWGYNDGSGRDISNKPVGWYTTAITTVSLWNGTAISIPVAASSSAKIVMDTRYSVYIPGGFKGVSQPALFNGVNTGSTFNWVIFNSDSGIWYTAIEHYNIPSGPGGTWTYSAPISFLPRTISGYDPEWGYYSYEQTLASVGWPGYGSTYVSPMCIMTIRNPVTLSVATTV